MQTLEHPNPKPKLPQRQTQLEPLKLSGINEVTRAACLRQLPAFGETFYPNWVAGRFHEYLGERLEDCLARKIKRICISVPPQHGKLVADETPICTENGWKTHGEIVEGDRVFRPTGQLVRVLKVFPEDVASLEVEMSNGAKIVVHEKHEWTLYDRCMRKWRTVETGNLTAVKLVQGTGEIGKRGLHHRFSLPPVSPLETGGSKKKHLRLAPYFLGVWLGDGKSSGPSFCFADKDEAILDRVIALGYPPTWRSKHKTTGVNYVGFSTDAGMRKGNKTRTAGVMLRALQRMDLIRNKHIPSEYLFSSANIRLELLAGLIDTDGSVHGPTGRICFTTCSVRLKDDFVELIRSFGWRPSVFTAQPCTSSSGIVGKQVVYVVGFNPDRPIPCALPRKAKFKAPARRRISVVAVRPVAPRPGRCIQVDCKDGLYLVGRELIPTHNSRETSVIFPSWALTKYPTLRFFQAGFDGDLSEGFSREARSLVQSERYRQFFPELINARVNRQDYWQTKLGGYYYATSVGGGSGMPADVAILDDVHRNREDANSPKKREKVWSWITSVVLPRLAPDGVLIIVGTRWHDDDAIGRFTNRDRVRELEEAGFKDMNFEVIRMEALCENPETDPLGRKMGESLWPEVRTAAMLRAKKIEIGVDEFNSLYQQKPKREGGLMVDVNDIVKIDMSDLPEGLRLSRGWDLALTVEQQSDYSCGARGAVNKYKIPLETKEDGTVTKWQEVEDFYLVHMDRGKRKWPEQKQRIIELGKQEAEAGNIVGLETVAGFKIGAAELVTSFHGECIVKSINVHKDKAARAQAWMAKFPAKRFFMVRGTWNKDFLSELEQFPHGVHDDQVDAVSVLYETVHKKRVAVFA